MRSISASGPNTAIIAPLSATETRVISVPRALTARSASPKAMLPAATRAPYSPKLCPMTKSGAIPYAPSSLNSAISTASTAGWVIAVCLSKVSARAICPASFASTKISSDKGSPKRGVITRSASSKVCATTLDACLKSLSIFTYCEPCPVNRKTSFEGLPLPRKIP